MPATTCCRATGFQRLHWHCLATSCRSKTYSRTSGGQVYKLVASRARTAKHRNVLRRVKVVLDRNAAHGHLHHSPGCISSDGTGFCAWAHFSTQLGRIAAGLPHALGFVTTAWLGTEAGKSQHVRSAHLVSGLHSVVSCTCWLTIAQGRDRLLQARRQSPQYQRMFGDIAWQTYLWQTSR